MISVNSGCSDVWPGDANSDGVVNSSDVLELGLAASSTGAARTPGGNSYVAQYASNWSGTVSSGKNKCHADCNGDGTVDNGDTLAIFNNFSLTHSFKPSPSSSDPEITIVIPQGIAYEGQWNTADIIMGSSAVPVNQVFGVLFEVNFDLSLIEPNSAYMKYNSSFLDNGQNIFFRKPDFVAGKIYAATVRTNGTNSNGNGKIAEFHYKLKSNLPAGSNINLSISNSSKINNSGQTSTVSAGSAAVEVTNNLVGINKLKLFEQSLNIYPNPAADKVEIRSSLAGEITYLISDITGRKIAEGRFTESTTLDLSNLDSGSYLIKLNSGDHSAVKKLVIE
jgi:hypothetical protein